MSGDDFEVEIGLNGDQAKVSKKKVKLEEVLVEVALEPLPPGRPAPPLDIYVAEARRAAEIVAKAKPTELTPAEIARRVDRAEEYAKYRWNGYVSGEIISL